ncbi:MAG: hypothetical protein ACYC1T_06735 [Sulfuricaulis sp.]
MSQHSTIGGVTVFRSPPYGHRVFGNACVFERAEVRIVGSTYRAVLCTWRAQADGDARLVAEYALLREYPTLALAHEELTRQREEHLLAAAEDRVEALQVARRTMRATVLGDTDPP